MTITAPAWVLMVPLWVAMLVCGTRLLLRYAQLWRDDELLRLRRDLADCRRMCETLSARVAAQGELLTRRAEADD